MTTTIPTLDQPLITLNEQDFLAFADSAIAVIETAADERTLQELRVSLSGKKSALTALSKQMGALDADAKKQYGAYLHELRTHINQALETKAKQLATAAMNAKLASEQIDISLPARGILAGGLHPITQTTERMKQFFVQAGFSVATGPEIESDYYNFEALNISSHHPARAMHDTFYFDAHYLLRTHTSSVQIRTMENSEPPIRIICPGRVYRCDSDQTHSPMFHQMEGLMISKSSNFAELKGLIHEFLDAFFGKKMTVRFRPSFFPFTEPSAEVDILSDNGKWLEVLGCGMVHPQVLKNCGINPDEYTGFAFGMGIERFAMLYYGIDDLRLFFQNDLRFLKQFS
ncbi:phenylalanine--tRNA ligase subunit alpha [Moraxella catarrhalis]|uniref:Phenylalanine--tRNA ligase alpha subunit n=1 Tax=Moraxella catarrhalis TaxID=480 RepID=A0AB36DMQ5_MORCA|nr:phenylalanine--tRNA ligase subunit alpha [Moraxella catarrhalis]MPX29444.1 phenylalanine--tRNA ligase subunit alpha [Moraxella catarrhalis]OAV23114.1 Phenylalanyl-tRNA synthetase alpha chain [Moraxella catarrhalis]RKL88100.1 phenylalanine--tRNA ligase subunit alpha [Moraxella catarrhalis]RKL89913.1 phenylalanine--tRNA ligase subunit alpha [Moraxella catarrhalis]RKM00482.1 phenylalanine--tRNA ligase subunit alpha [Moraxella catarrhalis]